MIYDNFVLEVLILQLIPYIKALKICLKEQYTFALAVAAISN